MKNLPGVYRNLANEYPLTARKQNRQFNSLGYIMSPRELARIQGLPDDFKIRNGTKKYLLREIVHKYVPKQMMDRPKMGFGVPIKEWFKSELAEYFNQYLSKTKIESQGLVNYNAVKVWLENYNCGRTEYINHLWYLLMFQMWYERWMK
jgi:asparagine synthase (glutamine-hydrolysing)